MSTDQCIFLRVWFHVALAILFQDVRHNVCCFPYVFVCSLATLCLKIIFVMPLLFLHHEFYPKNCRVFISCLLNSFERKGWRESLSDGMQVCSWLGFRNIVAERNLRFVKGACRMREEFHHFRNMKVQERACLLRLFVCLQACNNWRTDRFSWNFILEVFYWNLATCSSLG
jgi:hypothetical protein